MSTPAINCSNCRSRLFLHSGPYINPVVRCGNCYSSTRIFNPAFPFLGGVRIYFYTPPKPQAKKANPPERPSPKAKKVDPPKCPSPSPNANKANPPKPPSPSPNANIADPPKPPSSSPNAQKADSSNSTDVLYSKKEDGNRGILQSKFSVSGNQVSGNKGDQNGKFLVGDRMENIYIEQIIIQNGKHCGEDRKTETDGETETGGEEETDEETETDGETETDWETETNWETETDSETDSDEEAPLYLVMREKMTREQMMRRHRPRHYDI